MDVHNHLQPQQVRSEHVSKYMYYTQSTNCRARDLTAGHSGANGYTLLKPKRHSLRCHDFMIHA